MPTGTQIDAVFAKQFQAEVHEAYQRQGSKLRPSVRSKTGVTGSSTFFPKVGKGTAAAKTRNGAVPVMNLEHAQIECVLQDYYAGDWVDRLDQLKTDIDERTVIANAGAYAAAARRVDPVAAGLALPYVAWACFAALLSEELWRRNR